MTKRIKRLIKALIQFSEKGSASLLIVLCVGVITATAVWTSPDRTTYVAPTPPSSGEQSASLLMQQPLARASTPTPLPTTQPELWLHPLPEIEVLRSYSENRMLRSGVTGVWSIHPAVDLKAEYGAPVGAIAAGMVEACGESSVLGNWIQIQHGNSCTSLYAGLAMLSAIRPGDSVQAGQTIGFVGNTVIDETNLGPHLHLEIRRNDVPVDPLTLFGM